MKALLDELRIAGHLTGDVPAPEAELSVSRWILALQVAGGWLASLFLLAFVGLGASAFVKSGSGWLLLGVVATAIAGFGLRTAQAALVRQFLLPLSLAGQAAFAMGAVKIAGSGIWGWWLFAAFEMAVCVALTWPLHRFLAAIAVVYALQAATTHRTHADDFGLMSGWLQPLYWGLACLMLTTELRWRTFRHAEILAALVTALMVHSLVAVSLPLVLELGGGGWGRQAYRTGWSLPLLSFACLAYLGRNQWRSLRGMLLLGALIGALAVTWQSPGVGVGVTAMVLGFANGRRWLLWFGGIVTLAAIGRFYYYLPVDLLSKSGYLVLGGLLLLAVRLLLMKGAHDAA